MEPIQLSPIAAWNPVRDVWETGEASLLCGHSGVYSETWPSLGMTRSGVAYELPMLEPATDDTACSLLPTPVATEGTKPSNTMGVARRQATGQVYLTNVIVSLCGLDPTDTLSRALADLI